MRQFLLINMGCMIHELGICDINSNLRSSCASFSLYKLTVGRGGYEGLTQTHHHKAPRFHQLTVLHLLQVKRMFSFPSLSLHSLSPFCLPEQNNYEYFFWVYFKHSVPISVDNSDDKNTAHLTNNQTNKGNKETPTQELLIRAGFAALPRVGKRSRRP